MSEITSLQLSEDEYEKVQQKIHDEALVKFKKAMKGMVATSDAAYEDGQRIGKQARKASRVYTSEEIHRIVNNGTAIEQANLSEYFFATNGLYKRIILHYATFLIYSWVLVPYTLGYGKYKITDKQVSKAYFDASNFCTTFQIERKCALFARDVLVRGGYYGLVIDNGEDVVIQDLPFDYCRSRFKNAQDVDIVEFNLEFFKKIRDEKTRNQIIDSYPKVIQKAWRQYDKGKGDKWFIIPAELGVYFCFFEERPFFLDLIPLLDSLDDYKDIDRERNLQALKHILVQEMPHDGLKLVFEPQEAEVMHEGAVEMLSNNQDLDVITSYAKVSLLDMSSSDDQKTEISDMQNLIYSSAGMSKELFFATTEAGINYSVNNDLALVMVLGQRFAHFFTVLLNYKFSNKRVKFKLLIMPISYYNCHEYTQRARDCATLGYSFLTPILSTGIDQTNLAMLKALENDLLNLDEILKPLQSSYTQSGKKAGESMDQVKETDYLGNKQSEDGSAAESDSQESTQSSGKTNTSNSSGGGEVSE